MRRVTRVVPRPTLYLGLGQVFFTAMVACCWLIKPSQKALRVGVSYYGTQLETAGALVLGCAGCVALTAVALAAVRSRAPWFRRLRLGVGVVLALMMAIPLTPYSIDIVVDWVHIGIAATLFAVAYALGGWIAFRVRRTPFTLLLLLGQSTAAYWAAAAELGAVGWMLPSQMVFELTFAALVAVALAATVDGEAAAAW
jgi:hypothetical protein